MKVIFQTSQDALEENLNDTCTEHAVEQQVVLNTEEALRTRLQNATKNKAKEAAVSTSLLGSSLLPVPGSNAAEIKDLHVRIPLEAWTRARIAALQSGMPFKDYLTSLLFAAKPLESEPA